MKKKWISIIVVILVLGAYPVYQWTVGSQAEEAVEEKITEVKVKIGDLRITELADGNLVIPGSEAVSPYSGKIAAITAVAGTYVEEGDKVLELVLGEEDYRDLVFSLEEDLLKTDKERIDARETLVDLKTRYAEGLSLLGLMTDYPAMYSLSEVASQRDLVAALGESVNYADRAYAQALEAYETSKSSHETVLAEMAATGSLSVTAPYSGTLISLKGDIGDLVKVNNPLFTLGEIESAYVLSEVSELDMGQIAVGQKAVLNFEISYGSEIAGEVVGIDPEGKIDNNGIVTYEVRIRVTEPLPNVLNGLSAQVEYVIRERTDVLVIPNSAVKIVDGKQTVEIKTETGSERVAITAGFTDGIATEILSGLEVGQTLLIRTLR